MTPRAVHRAIARVALVALGAATLANAQVAPFELPRAAEPVHGRIDELIDARLRELDIEPALPCSDEVFVRRAFLDLIGTLPTPDEVSEFLDDFAETRRSYLIEDLLERPEFADFQTMKWCDLLRVKAEFPINLWPNAVQAYARWIHQTVTSNMPYDRFVTSLVQATGSNFRAPEVNFLRAVGEKTPAGLAKVTALSFLGARTENWPQDRRDGLAQCFVGVAYKRTLEWKEEIVYFDDLRLGGKPMTVVMPDGSSVRVEVGVDPRTALAGWLLQEPSRWLARCHCNRVWSWLFGRGIVHPPDDFRPDNPPSNPALLDYLAEEFVKSGYDQRHLLRTILTSAAYQRSAIPATRGPAAAAQFAHQTLRRHDAEVLIDAICQITGTDETYESPIPEPFTMPPAGTRAMQLADGSTTSSFLELFARSPRDTGLVEERNHRPTSEQRLHLLNSGHILTKLERGTLLRSLPRGDRGIERLFLTILSRRPTEAEIAAVRAHASAAEVRSRDLALDVAWALLNSAEFLYRH